MAGIETDTTSTQSDLQTNQCVGKAAENVGFFFIYFLLIIRFAHDINFDRTIL